MRSREGRTWVSEGGGEGEGEVEIEKNCVCVHTQGVCV